MASSQACEGAWLEDGADQSELLFGKQEFKADRAVGSKGKRRYQRLREREETRAEVMMHPEVDVISSQCLCGPRVGRQEEMHAGLSVQAFHTISFLAKGDWGCLYPLSLLKP